MAISINEALAYLIKQNTLEELDTHLYRGYASEGSVGRIYGGQVVAQAIHAAQQSVDEKYSLHSFHSYFLRPGNPDHAVIYEVDPIRDGRSFLTRRIVAKQKGRAIFNCSMSFQISEEGLSHQIKMPDVPAPENLECDKERFEAAKPGRKYRWPIEFRQVNPVSFTDPVPMEPVMYTWFKAPGQLPDDPRLHQQFLAYASDLPILMTSLRPHGVSPFTHKLMTATIDHSLWFHRPFRVDEWLLYEIHSDSSGGGRGISRGKIYSRNGELVASAMQEGLIRKID